MAWNTQTDPMLFHQQIREPDMESLSYWLTRLRPMIDLGVGEEVIVVLANRTGFEGDATYVGTSSILGIKDGDVRLYGILGRGEQRLLIVDTDDPPYARLRFEMKAGSGEEEEEESRRGRSRCRSGDEEEEHGERHRDHDGYESIGSNSSYIES